MSHRANPSAEFNRALSCAGPAESLQHLLLAAEVGCIRAQFLVGLAYQTGRGVEVDYAEAAFWYHKAAGSGEVHAIANLAVMSLLGQGQPVDDLDAYIWAQSAVGLGHTWLLPAVELLEARIAGGREVPGAKEILAALAPDQPGFSPCTRPACDLSRCSNH